MNDARNFRSRDEAHRVLDATYEALQDGVAPAAFISLLSRDEAEQALDAAFDAVPHGHLTGMILAVKDNIDVAGFDTTAACPGFAHRPNADADVDTDADCVAALRASGAVVIGKTNLDQFATGLVGTRSPYGAVSDVAVPERISGGSSSGSAVAVAAGLVDAALGTDTAGSGRVPAGLQGIVGIKPTLGIVSTTGVVPACESYDCVTVFARTEATAESVMEVMASTGSRAWPADVRFTAPLTPVVGVPAELPALSASWREAFDAAVEHLRAAGCEIRVVDLNPALEAARMLYDSALVAERAEAIGDVIAGFGPEAEVDPTVGDIVANAGRWSGVEVLRARRQLDAQAQVAMREWDGVDVLLVPTAPFHPTIAAVQADPIGVNSAMGTYTNFCNLMDLSAVAVPWTTVMDSGRPQDGASAGQAANFGVTVLARAFEDGVAAGVASLFAGGEGDGQGDGSQAEAQAQVQARSWTAAVGAQATIPLIVFGAHLRGQPLNRELRSLGASFVGDVETTSDYRLFALDTVPPKPGLTGPVQQGGSGEAGEAGARIAGEEWLISPAGLGRFLDALPAPMALGQVTLADGRSVTGFTCQPAAVEGAADISEFGGWRGYLARK
ncbi:allophanate hydrolase [Corynebacterium sp. AOP40-9SA-29]|uniref:allophanate hydrolase n=1 Tax=Corynebacterium sp. AOP40-9SA-29 TaxID=3457677 RepID=UPI0040332852